MNHSSAMIQFFQFLRQDLRLSEDSLNLIKKYANSSDGHLPMLLWQYGLINLAQLDLIFDWFEQKSILI